MGLADSLAGLVNTKTLAQEDTVVRLEKQLRKALLDGEQAERAYEQEKQERRREKEQWEQEKAKLQQEKAECLQREEILPEGKEQQRQGEEWWHELPEPHRTRLKALEQEAADWRDRWRSSLERAKNDHRLEWLSEEAKLPWRWREWALRAEIVALRAGREKLLDRLFDPSYRGTGAGVQPPEGTADGSCKERERAALDKSGKGEAVQSICNGEDTLIRALRPHSAVVTRQDAPPALLIPSSSSSSAGTHKLPTSPTHRPKTPAIAPVIPLNEGVAPNDGPKRRVAHFVDAAVQTGEDEGGRAPGSALI